MTEHAKRQPGEPPARMDKVFLGFLKKGPTWSPEADPQTTANQRAHLAGLQRLAEQGDLLLAGPTPESSDLRGILILVADDLQGAKDLMAEDAHLGTNRLVLELHQLYLDGELVDRMRPER